MSYTWTTPRTTAPAAATEVPRAWHAVLGAVVGLLVAVAVLVFGFGAANAPGVTAPSTGAPTATSPRPPVATFVPIPLAPRPAGVPASLLRHS